MGRFAGIELAEDTIADESTVLRFPLLLEAHRLIRDRHACQFWRYIAHRNEHARRLFSVSLTKKRNNRCVSLTAERCRGGLPVLR